MPMAFAASSSPFKAIHCLPYFDFLKNATNITQIIAATRTIGKLITLGKPEKPAAPPVSPVIWFKIAVKASPNPNVTNDI